MLARLRAIKTLGDAEAEIKLDDKRQSLGGNLIKQVRAAVKKDSTLDELKSLYVELNRVMPLLYEKPNSLNTNMTKLRNIVVKLFGKGSPEHTMTLKTMKVSDDIQEVLKKQAVQTLKKDMIPLSRKKFFSVLKETSESKTYVKAIIAVQMATGLRSIEAMNPEITFKKSERINFVIQMGVMKGKKSNTTTVEDIEIDKPLLGITFKQLMTLKRNITTTQKDSKRTIQEISQRNNKQLNETVSKLLGKGMTSHKLRGSYVAMAYDIYGGLTPKNAYIQSLLGHKMMETSLSYMNVKLTDVDVEQEIKDLRRTDAAQQVEIDALKGDVKAAEAPQVAVEAKAPVFAKNIKKRDGQTYNRMVATIANMRAAGVKPTVRELRKLGYGGKLAGKARKDGLME